MKTTTLLLTLLFATAALVAIPAATAQEPPGPSPEQWPSVPSEMPPVLYEEPEVPPESEPVWGPASSAAGDAYGIVFSTPLPGVGQLDDPRDGFNYCQRVVGFKTCVAFMSYGCPLWVSAGIGGCLYN